MPRLEHIGGQQTGGVFEEPGFLARLGVAGEEEAHRAVAQPVATPNAA